MIKRKPAEHNDSTAGCDRFSRPGGPDVVALKGHRRSCGLFACLLMFILPTNTVAQEAMPKCDESLVHLLESAGPKMPRSQVALELAMKRNQYVKLTFVVELDGTVGDIKTTYASNKVFIKPSKKALRAYRYSVPEQACTLDVKYTFRLRVQ